MGSCCSNCKWCCSNETGWYDDYYYVCMNSLSKYFQMKINYKDICEKYENL